MAKLIRGKIIVESKQDDSLETVEPVSFTPLDLSDPDDYEDDADQAAYEQTELLPEQEGSTFASAIAPWVGAEKAWRSGFIAAGERQTGAYRKSREHDKTPLELELSESEMNTVLSSMPPARQQVARRSMMRLLSYSAVAAISVVLTWLVTSMAGSGTGSAGHPTAETVPTEELQVLHAAPVSGCVPGAAGALCGDDLKTEDNVASPQADTVLEFESVAEPTSDAEGALVIASADSQETASVSESDVDNESANVESQKRRPRLIRRRAVVKAVTVSEDPVAASDEAAPPDADEGATNSGEEAVAKPPAEPQLSLAVETPRPSPSLETDLHLETNTPADDVAAALLAARVETPDSQTKAAALPASPSAQRTSLSKAVVRQTMESIAPKVKACRKSVSGRVVVELIVSGATGRVISARANGQTEVGATAAQCAVHKAELLKFPTFEKDQLAIKYPYDL